MLLTRLNYIVPSQSYHILKSSKTVNYSFTVRVRTFRIQKICLLKFSNIFFQFIIKLNIVVLRVNEKILSIPLFLNNLVKELRTITGRLPVT